MSKLKSIKSFFKKPAPAELRNFQILLLGDEGAGKTSLVERMRESSNTTKIPVNTVWLHDATFDSPRATPYPEPTERLQHCTGNGHERRKFTCCVIDPPGAQLSGKPTADPVPEDNPTAVPSRIDQCIGRTDWLILVLSPENLDADETSRRALQRQMLGWVEQAAGGARRDGRSLCVSIVFSKADAYGLADCSHRILDPPTVRILQRLQNCRAEEFNTHWNNLLDVVRQGPEGMLRESLMERTKLLWEGLLRCGRIVPLNGYLVAALPVQPASCTSGVPELLADGFETVARTLSRPILRDTWIAVLLVLAIVLLAGATYRGRQAHDIAVLNGAIAEDFARGEASGLEDWSPDQEKLEQHGLHRFGVPSPIPSALLMQRIKLVHSRMMAALDAPDPAVELRNLLISLGPRGDFETELTEGEKSILDHPNGRRLREALRLTRRRVEILAAAALDIDSGAMGSPDWASIHYDVDRIHQAFESCSWMEKGSSIDALARCNGWLRSRLEEVIRLDPLTFRTYLRQKTDTEVTLLATVVEETNPYGPAFNPISEPDSVASEYIVPGEQVLFVLRHVGTGKTIEIDTYAGRLRVPPNTADIDEEQTDVPTATSIGPSITTIGDEAVLTICPADWSVERCGVRVEARQAMSDVAFSSRGQSDLCLSALIEAIRENDPALTVSCESQDPGRLEVIERFLRGIHPQPIPVLKASNER